MGDDTTGWSLGRHCRDTLRLGTAGILGGWSLKSASGRARTTSTLKSNNPTARVGNNHVKYCLHACRAYMTESIQSEIITIKMLCPHLC